VHFWHELHTQKKFCTKVLDKILNKLPWVTIPSTTGIHTPMNTVKPWTGNLTINDVCTKKKVRNRS